MANEIDLLMDKDPEKLTKDDVAQIVHYQRQHLANIEAGIKPKKEKGTGLKLDDLASGMIKNLKPQSTFKRRF